MSWIAEYKWQITTGALALVAASSWLRPAEETIIERQVDKIVTVEKEVIKYKDRVVYRDRSKRTIIEKPDGTKVIIDEETKEKREVTEVEGGRENSNEISKETEKIVTRPSLSRYRLGLLYPPLSYPDHSEVTLTGGARLGNLPLFVELSAAPLVNKYMIGVSYEW